MRFGQKIARVFSVSLTLLVISLLSALIVSLGAWAIEQVRLKIITDPELITALCIVVTSLSVNALCVMVVLKVKKLS